MPIKRGLFGGNFRKFFPEKGWNLKNFSLKVGVPYAGLKNFKEALFLF